MSVQISYRAHPGSTARTMLFGSRTRPACMQAGLLLLLVICHPGAAAADATGGAATGGPPGTEADSLPSLRTGWHTPDEILLAPSPTAVGTFEHLAARFSSERILGAAEKKAARWLQVDEVELDGSGVRLRKEYGDRFEVATFTGIGAWAESGVLAEYRLFGGWFLRSETRERGESYLEIRRVFKLR